MRIGPRGGVIIHFLSPPFSTKVGMNAVASRAYRGSRRRGSVMIRCAHSIPARCIHTGDLRILPALKLIAIPRQRICPAPPSPRISCAIRSCFGAPKPSTTRPPDPLEATRATRAFLDRGSSTSERGAGSSKTFHDERRALSATATRASRSSPPTRTSGLPSPPVSRMTSSRSDPAMRSTPIPDARESIQATGHPSGSRRSADA